MKKDEFVMMMLANNINLFSNVSALRNNVRDMIKTAESIYDVTQEEMAKDVKEATPLEKLRQSKK